MSSVWPTAKPCPQEVLRFLRGKPTPLECSLSQCSPCWDPFCSCGRGNHCSEVTFSSDRPSSKAIRRRIGAFPVTPALLPCSWVAALSGTRPLLFFYFWRCRGWHPNPGGWSGICNSRHPAGGSVQPSSSSSPLRSFGSSLSSFTPLSAWTTSLSMIFNELRSDNRDM